MCCSWWTGPRTLQIFAKGMDQMERTSPGAGPAPQSSSDIQHLAKARADTAWKQPLPQRLLQGTGSCTAIHVLDMGLAAFSSSKVTPDASRPLEQILHTEEAALQCCPVRLLQLCSLVRVPAILVTSGICSAAGAGADL